MKKRTIPRVASVLLAASMGLGLCACGGTPTGTKDADKASHFFKTEYLDGVLNQEGKEINTVKIFGDKLYYCAYDAETYSEHTFSAYDVIGNTDTTLWVGESETNEDDIQLKDQYLNQCAVDANGNAYLYVSTMTVKEECLNRDYDNATYDDVINFMVDEWAYSEEDAQNEWDTYLKDEYTDDEGNPDYGKFLKESGMAYDNFNTLVKVDAEGNIIYEKDMNAEGGSEESNSYCDGMAADAAGNLYLCINEWTDEADTYYIDILDGEGNKKGTIDLDDYSAGMINNYDGSVSYLTWGESGYDAYRIDADTCKAEKTINVTEPNVVYYDEENIFVSDGTALYLQSVADGTKEKYLNWIDYNIAGSNVSSYGMLSNGNLVVYTQNWTDNGQDSQIILMTEVDESEVTVAENITVACMWLDSTMEQRAIEFNKKHDDYHIVIKEFYDDSAEDWEAMLNSFTTAIANDSSIDIVIFDDYSQVTNFASKGLMMDMYELIDQDEELSRDDFMPNILTACEMDGKLVVLPTGFSLQTLIGKSEDVGDEPGWTIEEMQALLASKPEGTQLLYGMTRDTALNNCISLGYRQFINAADATCDFDNEDFISVLEFANMFPEEFEWQEEDDETVMLNNGEVLLTQYYLSDFQEIQMYTEVFGGDVTYIGYPANEGNGALLSLNTIYGITNNCEHTDVAWEFLRQFYLPADDSEGGKGYGFSVRKDEFEAYCENATKPNDENSGTWGWGSFEVEMKPATQEQVDDVKELVYGTTAISGAVSTEIMNIINEEAAYYFSGEQSAEEVAAKIQSRMTIYLSETK